jgi:hypothetical protein
VVGLGGAAVAVAAVAGVAGASTAGSGTASMAAGAKPGVAQVVAQSAPQSQSPMSQWTPKQFEAMAFAMRAIYDKAGVTTPVSSTQVGSSTVYDVVLKQENGTKEWVVEVNMQYPITFTVKEL